MTPERRRAKILLLQHNKTFSDLAHAAGLAEATVHNVLDGHASSRKSKQAITNALGAVIFDGINVTARPITLPAGLEVELDTEAEAIDAEKEFAGFIERAGRTITFIKPTPATIGESDTTNLSARRAAKRTRTQKQPASKSAAAS